eukprot:jgi/Tetstr1/457671/TSEL_044218.t1
MVNRLAEAIAATISQGVNTPPELHHAQWLTDIMMAVGVEMQQYHTEPKLLRVGDDNLCAPSPSAEDEEFADTLRMAVALTSHVALLRAICLRTIVIYLTESEFDPPEGEDVDELELNYEENDGTMDVDTAQRGAAEAQGLADISLDSP